QRDHGTVGAVKAAGRGEIPEVVDAVCQTTVTSGPLRVAHIQLIHSDDSPRVLGVEATGHHGPPQVRPRGVTMHGEDRAHWCAAGLFKGRAVIEVVPPTRGAGVYRGGGGDADRVGPSGVDPWPLGGLRRG